METNIYNIYKERRRAMTREKEIKTQAQLYSPNDIGVRAAFEESARWADRTMIDKACKWLEKKACLYIWKNCEQGEHGIHKTMLEDFREAMKGE